MAIVANQDIEATDLASEIGALAGGGNAHANYSAGEWVLESHGAPQILAISVTNADVHRRPPVERDALFARFAEAGAAWLRRRGLVVAGTLVSFSLMREVDLRVASTDSVARRCLGLWPCRAASPRNPVRVSAR